MLIKTTVGLNYLLVKSCWEKSKSLGFARSNHDRLQLIAKKRQDRYLLTSQLN